MDQSQNIYTQGLVSVRLLCYADEYFMKGSGKQMVQVLLFGLVGFSSALVNLGIYNLMLWLLQTLALFPGVDFLVAQFFGFVISVAWAFWFNRRYVFSTPGAPWKESLIKVYITYSLTGIGLSSLLSLLWIYELDVPKEVVTLLNDVLCFPVNFLLNKYWSFRKK